MAHLMPILQLLGLSLAYRLGRSLPAWALGLAGFLLLPLVAWALLLLQPLWEYSLLQGIGYLPWRPFLLYSMAVPLLGCVAGTLPKLRARRLFLALGLLLIAHGVDRNHVLLLPTVAGEKRAPGPDHHLQQSGPNTCVAAATAIALSYLGEQRTEQEMAVATLTHRKGTSFFDAYRGLAMTLVGTHHQASLHPEHSLDPSTPGRILIVNDRDAGHALCLIGLGNELRIQDPLLDAPTISSPQRTRTLLQGPLILLTPGTPPPQSTPVR